ncbi:MAG: bifunctional pyr operon transcriptional regulator/uracil phosphoribosyltransferase PyrR [Oscillospiraceae bacterium]|nr:bifunctional pyr operon transcriptional regulator/uracil phosphoribosyltransferase PyrR [Oscillospiraceae bacterium]
MEEKNIIMDENAMYRATARITYEILERNKGAENLCLVGILSRGAVIARRICEKIRELEGVSVSCSVLDITPYRDDVPHDADYHEKTDIPFSMTDKNVIICDDVLFTGRSCRAAIDAVIKRGRPKSIQLAALVDRGHRELPIRPDYVGKNVPTSHSETVKVQVREVDGVDKVSIFHSEMNKE